MGLSSTIELHSSRNTGDWNGKLAWLQQFPNGRDFRKGLIQSFCNAVYLSNFRARNSKLHSQTPLSADAVIQTVRYTIKHCFEGGRNLSSAITTIMQGFGKLKFELDLHSLARRFVAATGGLLYLSL
ncbi:hypothetical protein NL676_000560 [Syzygium grande]|nr:hypothetical protein NL676_000560 [Syzygium grande]